MAFTSRERFSGSLAYQMYMWVSMMYRCIAWSGIEVSNHSNCIVESNLVFFGQRSPASKLGIVISLLSSIFKLDFFHNRNYLM